MVCFFFFKCVFESGVVSFILRICSHVLSLLKRCRDIFEPHKSLIKKENFMGNPMMLLTLFLKQGKVIGY